MVKATTKVSRRESQQLERLLAEIRACRICEEHLALGPRPVVVASDRARVLIAGQAPGAERAIPPSLATSGLGDDDTVRPLVEILAVARPNIFKNRRGPQTGRFVGL